METMLRGQFTISYVQEKCLRVPLYFEAYSPALVHQKIFHLSSLLKSRLKLCHSLKTDEIMHPSCSCLCMDFVFYDIESSRGFVPVLDVTCLSTRHNKKSMRRSKYLPLDVRK